MLKERSEIISALQTFGIFLVVLGHSNPGDPVPNVFEWLQKYIYSFHMPLFMVISGYLFSYTGGIRNDYFHFIKIKTVRLLIPYFVISSLAFIPKVALSKFAMRPIDLSLSTFVHNFIYPWENVIIFFWFLPTLFLIFVVSPIFDFKNNTPVKTLIITISLVLLNIANPLSEIKFLNLSGVCSYLIYFWIGCLMANNWAYVIRFFSKKTSLIIFLLTTIALSIISSSLKEIGLISAITGVIMSFCLCQQYLLKNIAILRLMDGYSYQIYLLSWFPQIFFKIICFQILHLDFYIVSVFMFISGILFPTVILKLMSKSNKTTRMIIGL